MKNKKIISVLVLALVLSGAYFVKDNFTKKATPGDLSLSLIADFLPYTYNINYKSIYKSLKHSKVDIKLLKTREISHGDLNNKQSKPGN